MHKYFSQQLLLMMLFILVVGCQKTNRQTNEIEQFRQFCLQNKDYLNNNPNYIIEQCRERMSDATDSIAYYNYLTLISKMYIYKGRADSAMFPASEVLTFCTNYDNQDSESLKDLYADIYNIVGGIYARTSQFDASIDNFKKAYNYCSNNNVHHKRNVAINMADLYSFNGQFDETSQWYYKALSQCDSLSLPESDRFPIYYGLGRVYMQLRNYNLCDYYFDLAFKYYDEMVPFERFIYLNNRGNAYFFREDYEKALEYFRGALAQTHTTPDLQYENNLCKINLGEVFLRLNQPDSAQIYLDECYDYFVAMDQSSALYYMNSLLAELALLNNNNLLANSYLQKQVDMGYIDPEMLALRYQSLQNYYSNIGDYKRAYQYQSRKNELNDSIRNERIKLSASESALRYERDSTLVQHRLLIQAKENEVMSLRMNIYMWVFICIVIVLISFIGYILWKRKMQIREIKNKNIIVSLRMENIRNRVSPHFVFNVLNQEIVHQSATDRQDLIGLVKLLRRNLELASQLAIPLEEELDFVQTYVSLERRRLNECFSFEVSIEKGIDVSKIMIPAMVIQIPVENAIKHALAQKEDGRLKISIVRKENGVMICIEDNGGGFKVGSTASGTGTGLKVIRQTIGILNQYNKQPIEFTIKDSKFKDGSKGCEVVIEVPYSYNYKL